MRTAGVLLICLHALQLFYFPVFEIRAARDHVGQRVERGGARVFQHVAEYVGECLCRVAVLASLCFFLLVLLLVVLLFCVCHVIYMILL